MKLVDLTGTFIVVLGLDVHFEKVVDCCLEFTLNVSEFLVNFISQDFAENSNIVVLGRISLDSGYYATSCFNCQAF